MKIKKISIELTKTMIEDINKKDLMLSVFNAIIGHKYNAIDLYEKGKYFKLIKLVCEDNTHNFITDNLKSDYPKNFFEHIYYDLRSNLRYWNYSHEVLIQYIEDDEIPYFKLLFDYYLYQEDKEEIMEYPIEQAKEILCEELIRNLIDDELHILLDLAEKELIRNINKIKSLFKGYIKRRNLLIKQTLENKLNIDVINKLIGYL